MVFRDAKLINKDYLHKWLTREVINSYGAGLDDYSFGGKQRIVKVLKFLRLKPDGSLSASVSDSNNFILAVISKDCVSEYESENRCRITEYTTNCLVIIRKVKLRWVGHSEFRYSFGTQMINQFKDVASFAVLEIGEIRMFDADPTEYLIKLESVYTTPEYRDVVKPYQVHEDVLQCL